MQNQYKESLPDLLKIFLNRSSVRKYTDKKISASTMDHLFQAAIQAPTSSHIQAFSIINVTDMKVRQHFSNISGNQSWIVEASHFLLFCADLYKVTQFAKFDITSPEVSQDSYLASIIDAGLVGMTLSLAAEQLGIGSVMIGSVRNSLEESAALVNLPVGVVPLFGMCLGYYEARKKPKPRLSKDLFVFENQYNLPQNASSLLEEYHRSLSQYYKESALELEGLRAKADKTWLEVAATAVKNTKRRNIGHDLKKRGFDLSAIK
jgi:nitroreductase